MKKLISIFICLICVLTLLAGCSRTPDEVKLEVAQLEEEVASLEKQVKTLTATRDNLDIEIKEITGEAIYIIELEVGIDRFALDFENMMKDAMNEFTFEIIVSEEYYNSLSVGDRLNEAVRMGSIVLAGSYGKQYVEVISKRIA